MLGARSPELSRDVGDLQTGSLTQKTTDAACKGGNKVEFTVLGEC